jgi:hypothetical protein
LPFRLLADTHYVDINCATPVAPYLSWETAATVIQDAIDVSTNEDIVLVADGSYTTGGRAVYGTLTNRIAVASGLSVKSVNGPSATFIIGKGPNGNSAIRCAYVGTNSVLEGFSLLNGATLTSGSPMDLQSGGGVWCTTSGIVTNCVFKNNSANYSGGGVYQGILKRCALTLNYANNAGGGAYQSRLESCALTNNWATSGNPGGGGGGAFGSTLSSCTVIGNHAPFGGGVAQSMLCQCEVSNNFTPVVGPLLGGGGGVYRSTLYACVLKENTTPKDGGGANASSLTHCKLVANTASSGGGSYNCALTNCIVYYNDASMEANCWGGTSAYCCMTPSGAGDGNFEDEPCLVSGTHIATDSPCVGRGCVVETGLCGVDFDGDEWGNPPSVGADEPTPDSATGPLSVTINTLYSQVVNGFDVALTARIQGHATRSVWDFGDGTAVSNRPFVSHAWVTAGVKNVKLTAWNESNPSNGVSATRMITVLTQAVYYVNIANTNPVSPYASWETAATNIQQALSVSSAGGREVLVMDGIYDVGGKNWKGLLANRIALYNGVTVRSVNGPDRTFIKGSGPLSSNAVRCAYVDKGCLLAGFTLTNGYTFLAGGGYSDQRGGGVYCEVDGWVSNCWIVGNSALFGGGATGGNLIGCLLSDNSASSSGGAAESVNLFGCQLINNTANAGGGVYNAKVRNCLVVRNVAKASGGGAIISTLENCTVSDNVSSNSAPGGAANCSLLNTILWNNMWRENLSNHSSCTAMTYCCTTPSSAGFGNITNNSPQFRDAENGDYRLSVNSPCIDAGLNSQWMFESSDLDSNPRFRGGTVDMGAYEFAYAVNVRCLLQGPYDLNEHAMVTPFIYTNNLFIPHVSPYRADQRKVAVLPLNVVDWVLLEVQDLNRSPVFSASAFLDCWGRVLNTVGDEGVPIDIPYASGYYLVLRHRNHLAAVSEVPMAVSNEVTYVDLTLPPEMNGGAADFRVELEPGVWGLIGGDADGDGRITPVDREIVERQKGKTGYLQGDLNLDGKVDGGD